jgi:hypothetical protein
MNITFEDFGAFHSADAVTIMDHQAAKVGEIVNQSEGIPRRLGLIWGSAFARHLDHPISAFHRHYCQFELARPDLGPDEFPDHRCAAAYITIFTAIV